MTSVNTDHPFGIPYIELTGQGRRISFRKDCLGQISILRKVDDGEWTELVQNTRSPYLDSDEFPAGSKLSYKIELDVDGEKKQYELEASL